MQLSTARLGTLFFGACLSGPALSTNGFAPHGIGMTSKGMGGTTIGYQGDAVALGANPAGAAFMENRLDAGIDLFRPSRGAVISGNGAGANSADGTYDGNDTQLFPIPEFGYRRGVGDKLSFGLSVFGNGGMNTDYRDGVPLFNVDPETGQSMRTGVNLMQLFAVPAIAWKPGSRHGFGVGLNLVAQGFESKGLTNFDNPQFSASPGNVTDNGTDWSFGAGLRFGWVGHLAPRTTLGATYQTRTSMTAFDEYAGLFAGQGDFDVPSNYGVGLAFQATPSVLLAADVMQINYSELDAVANAGQAMAQLGADNGPGFGWEDQTVIKLGVEVAVNQQLTVRAGFNHGDSPIPSSQTLFNILAPGVVEDHVTLGATWQINSGLSVTTAYMHAFEKRVDGNASISPDFGGGEADISMSQNSIGLAFSWKPSSR